MPTPPEKGVVFEKLYKSSEVAELFGVTIETVRTWLKDGSLKGIKIGNGYNWRISESEVIKLANGKYGDDDDSA